MSVCIISSYTDPAPHGFDGGGLMQEILLVVITLTLGGILAAVKSGFNEVIKGLESVDQHLSGDRSP